MSSLILEQSDDSISKFTSLVRARDLSSSANPLVRYCHFGVSPVNFSDSDSDSERNSGITDYLMVGYESLTAPHCRTDPGQFGQKTISALDSSAQIICFLLGLLGPGLHSLAIILILT